MKKLNILFAAVMLFTLVFTQGAGTSQAADSPLPVVRYATRYDAAGVTIPDPQPPNASLIVPEPKRLPGRPAAGGNTPDPITQIGGGAVEAPAPTASFDGIGATGYVPPDTVGDIGPNHYVQAVNVAWAVYDRAGAKLYGPANINTIFSGFGGPCQTTNNGDPIVLYDHLADRWFISQFAFPNGSSSGPYYQCIAISQTGSPTGSWNRYEFLVSNTKLNDYPKFGVWPDGYYMSINQFNQGSFSWGGQGVVVFERDKMLAGQPARMVYYDLYATDANLGGMLPSDLDGPIPPAGAPNPFIEEDDDAWGYSPDQLQLWQFHVDWTNTANSSFTKVGTLPVAAFDSSMCGGSRACIPQKGTTAKVDAIADRLMNRLQYRNFGTHQTLVVNATVDATGADRAGVRWYELRNTGGGWSIYQQSTFSPDANHRWMASAAMNKNGTLGLGYSISSSTMNPSIYYTGRLSGDPLNQMTLGEGIMVTGTGSQTDTSYSRWGDYSNLSVDPVDDCTFWYTQEYYKTTGTFSWSTRIGSFKLDGCGGGGDTPPTVTITNPTEGATVSGTINVTATAIDDNGVTQVQFFVDDVSIGTDTTSGDGWSASWNTTTATNAAHVVKAVATDTINQTGQDIKNVTVNNGGGGSTVLHVGDLDATKNVTSRNWSTTVTIYVHDGAHAPVAGVKVNAQWSSGVAKAVTCTTDSTGKCSLTRSLTNRITSIQLSVTGLSKTGYTYSAAANHDPDGDSNGTVITINK